MSITRLVDRQTPRVNRQTSRPLSKEQQMDNTILSFVKQMENKQPVLAIKPFHKQVSSLFEEQGTQIKNRITTSRVESKVSNVEKMLINKLETGYDCLILSRMQKLPIQEQEQMSRMLQIIDSGEPRREEIVGILRQKRLQVRILSNYGHPKFVGLTSIELLDNEEKLIVIGGIMSDCDSKNCVGNLINGHNYTINENQMWLTQFTQFPITISLNYDSEKLNGIRIWNFNKNRLELDKGAKKIEIIQNDTILFSGELMKGVAHTYNDFAQTIILKNPNQFYQSMQSMNSKKSDDNKDTNISKNSSKYTRPKLIQNPFDEDFKQKKFENNFLEPSSVKTKMTGGNRFFKNPITLFQKQHTEEDCTSSPIINIKRGVAHIAAGLGTGRTKRITIPETPIGSKLVFKILNNWGDMHFVGLTAIELYNCNGQQIIPIKITGFFKNSQILFNNNCITQDDNHMCLNRLSKQMEIKVEIQEQKIAMIRIWNYNKARIYTSKCVRQLEISLDGDQIFCGEIKQSNGSCGPENAEYIMFTQNQKLLKFIGENDWLNQLHESQLQQQRNILENTTKLSRPDTATFNRPKAQYKLKQTDPIIGQHTKRDSLAIQPTNNQFTMQKKVNSCSQIKFKYLQCVNIKVLKITILRNWGDRYLVGLDKIELIDKTGQPLDVKQYRINCSQYQSVKSTYERWSSPNGQVEIRFTFKEFTSISSIQIWNYNKEDELEKGIQLINIHGDDILLNTKQGIYLSKGSGLKESEPQIIQLPYQTSVNAILSNYQFEEQNYNQYYETTQLPQGTKLMFKLIQTWGDLYYIGLNGLEIFNPVGDRITPKLIASPHSIRELPQMEMDIRTPDKLLNNNNVTMDAKQMWLAPYLNSYTERLISNINSSLFEQIHYQVNKLVFYFDTPTQISAISLYNYSKTPSRGVREIEISMDDYILYRGYLNISTLFETPRGLQGENKTSILFTHDERLIEQINTVGIRESMLGSDTIMINERVTENTLKNAYMHKSQQGYPQLDRPTTTQIY